MKEQKCIANANEKKVLTARIPIAFDLRLQAIASLECRSVSSLVNQALKEFLEKRENA